MTTVTIDPAALRVLRAQARTVAKYHCDWQRDLAACQSDVERQAVGEPGITTAAHPNQRIDLRRPLSLLNKDSLAARNIAQNSI
jgi:hypothetical protein